ncbi:MAG: methyltransferase domain-containing protein, partial [Syntrophales bacterium]|nr:methyltransferase domain-containing protein [Syntrophales bacterium]
AQQTIHVKASYAPETAIIDAFADIETHRRMGELIRRVSTNGEDIRRMALADLDLRGCRRIMDLGCAFGAFTAALKGRIHPEATAVGLDVIPSYASAYLQSCRQAGIAGKFSAAGTAGLAAFADASFDLILCSYALYFFPEAIPELARLLHTEGTLVAITHFRGNARELLAAIKHILRERFGRTVERLPLELIIDRFAAENGHELLQPWFDSIETRDFLNNLVFSSEDIDHLFAYLRFKGPFFFAGTGLEKEALLPETAAFLRAEAQRQGRVTVTKDDRIFICRRPVHKGDKREERP